MDEHLKQYYGQLVGFTVTGLGVQIPDKDDPSRVTDDPTVALVLERGSQKKIAWIVCDEEGNGTGWLDIE